MARTKKNRKPQRPSLNWPPIVARGAEIVRGYDTPVTLRQLFYRLVAEQAIPNDTSAYGVLSRRTSAARDEGTFPDLEDRGRSIHLAASWADPQDAMADFIDWYRIDRTEGQEFSVYLAVEKATLISQMEQWFRGRGIPILAMGGYASTSYAHEVRANVDASTRPAILLYAGDFDSTGVDIDRSFVEKTGNCWAEVVRVALTRDQVDQYDLTINDGKETDTRSAAFVEKYGELMQVELEALDPPALHQLFEDALEPFWDVSTFEDALDQEAEGREALETIAGELE